MTGPGPAVRELLGPVPVGVEVLAGHSLLLAAGLVLYALPEDPSRLHVLAVDPLGLSDMVEWERELLGYPSLASVSFLPVSSRSDLEATVASNPSFLFAPEAVLALLADSPSWAWSVVAPAGYGDAHEQL